LTILTYPFLNVIPVVLDGLIKEPKQMTTQHTEKSFEKAIENHLITHAGYQIAPNTQFDTALALDKTTLTNFIKTTQKNVWQKLKDIHGTPEKIVERIANECDKHGLLHVIRKGVKDRGQLIRLAYFKPATTLNQTTLKHYNQNKLTVMRQIKFNTQTHQTIDMLLSLNGLPIATIELKNPFTGQRAIHAIKQYLRDRQPTIHTPLLQRALIHFALDTDEVYMTTRLAGKETIFLPFNQGDSGGKGNPVNNNGYKTAYLWENIWQKDSWLDIIQRFILDTGNTYIFPRYHQLTATRLLLASAKTHGTSKNYLIQHSAGSGKTNTISWTAHQLASLHDDNNQPIFDSIIVVSDRRNLDKQLQDNIYQIEHKQGVVEKIDDKKSATDLAEALNKGTRIIISTLQKFSFILDKVNDFSHKRFAVIIDEAHSSQSGQSAANLRVVLGSSGKEENTEDFILKEIKRHGKQPNISFLAFTATPKHKTLQMFGEPFHLYSMRQAIEEGFIHDVLKYYTTYKTYYELY
jgi:type I restriction enzyme R subunit